VSFVKIKYGAKIEMELDNDKYHHVFITCNSYAILELYNVLVDALDKDPDSCLIVILDQLESYFPELSGIDEEDDDAE
jgi:hypothetical protein